MVDDNDEPFPFSPCGMQVGGKFTSEALPHMADRGRVLVCGAISTYNSEGDILGPQLTSE